MNESSSAGYTATATWDDGSTSAVSPIWSVSPATYAGISADGLLTTKAVPGVNKSITITAKYTAGGVTTQATKPVTILDVPPDTTAPVLTVTTPQDGAFTNNAALIVSGSVNEAATVTIAVNSGTPQAVNLSNNSFNASVNLAAGSNAIDITATDLAGNRSSTRRTIICDNTKPTVTITVPTQDITTAQSTLLLQGTVSDTLSATSVSITMDGQTYTPAVTDKTFQQQLSFTTAKQYVITVTAVDQAGNSTIVRRNIMYAGRFGDVNSDAIVNVFDALLVLQNTVGLFPPADETTFKALADVAPLDANGKPKGDGQVNVFDALAILRHAVGLDGW